MKSLTLRKTILVLFVWNTVACNHSDNESDYRDDFIGEFVGIRTNTSWSLGNPYVTVQSEDTVLVAVAGDSSLNIDGVEVVIGEDGSFFMQGGGSISSYYSANFFNRDSLITDQNNGGLGGGFRTTFKGKK